LFSEGEEGERSCCPHHQASAALSLLGEQKVQLVFTLFHLCVCFCFVFRVFEWFFVLEGLAGVRVRTPYFVSFGKKKKKKLLLLLLLGFCRSAFCCEKSVCLVSGGAARFVSWRMNCSLSL